ncbi:MAG: hypothetical protein E7628_01315 [Ruminococcaceae bacterium]|nr:hypothetical protein [Oscillospiraceae bacterium]
MKTKTRLSFKFKYLVYVLILVCLALLATAYVWTLLTDYEDSQPEKKVEFVISNLKSAAKNDTIWNEYAFPEVGESIYEDIDLRSVYETEFAEGDLTYKLKPGTLDDDSLIYSILDSDDNVVAEVTLNSLGDPVTKLAVFTIQEWEIASVEIIAEIKTYTIDAPDDFTVTVNGIVLGDDVRENLEDGTAKYTISNVYALPNVVITSPEGETATYKVSGTKILTEYYDYSLTLPAAITVYLNGELHEGEDLGDGTVRHKIRSLEQPYVEIEDQMGIAISYTGGNTLPLTYCQIIADDTYTLSINNIPLPESMTTVSDNPDYEHLEGFVNDLPKTVTYNIAVLMDEAPIAATDATGKTIFIDPSVYSRDLTSTSTGASVPESIAAEIDVLAIAKKWSLFMSKDLTGTNYGFWDLANHLVKGSYRYDVAYKYATGIDITFTSIHTLKDPAFVNEQVTNFRWITDDCFAVDISFDKQMVLGDGRDLVDTMNSTFYFAKNDKTGYTWKILEIKEIVK